MSTLMILLSISFLEWYVIDKFKVIWSNFNFRSYITIAVSIILSLFLVFSLGLDILVALGLVEIVSLAGQLMTVLILSSGSSAVAEIIEHFERK